MAYACTMRRGAQKHTPHNIFLRPSSISSSPTISLTCMSLFFPLFLSSRSPPSLVFRSYLVRLPFMPLTKDGGGTHVTYYRSSSSSSSSSSTNITNNGTSNSSSTDNNNNDDDEKQKLQLTMGSHMLVRALVNLREGNKKIAETIKTL